MQIFWRLAGLRDSAADHYLRKQKSELDWIRNAVRLGTSRGARGPADRRGIRGPRHAAGPGPLGAESSRLLREGGPAGRREGPPDQGPGKGVLPRGPGLRGREGVPPAQRHPDAAHGPGRGHLGRAGGLRQEPRPFGACQAVRLDEYPLRQRPVAAGATADEPGLSRHAHDHRRAGQGGSRRTANGCSCTASGRWRCRDCERPLSGTAPKAYPGGGRNRDQPSPGAAASGGCPRWGITLELRARPDRHIRSGPLRRDPASHRSCWPGTPTTSGPGSGCRKDGGSDPGATTPAGSTRA